LPATWRVISARIVKLVTTLRLGAVSAFAIPRPAVLRAKLIMISANRDKKAVLNIRLWVKKEVIMTSFV
jgi:hypothetical protein